MKQSQKIKQLEKEIVDLKIKQHKDNYIHIPKPNLLPLLGIIIFGLLAYGNYFLIDSKVIHEVFKLCEDKCIYNLTTHDLINIYPIIGEYILISLAIISLFALVKGGYKKLNSIKEKGLTFGLIAGLIGGLTPGLIGGLIAGLTFGLIAGLIAGLIGGLIAGLIGGLICGLGDEFI